MSDVRDAVLDDAAGLIAQPSENPPGEEASVAAWLVDRFDRSTVSFDVDRVDVAPDRPNVVARVGDASKGSILLTGHMDAVPANPDEWTVHPYQPTVRDGRLIGRGSADMKGALAAMIVATERYVAQTSAPGEVILAFVVDEEHGGAGTRSLVEQGIDADLAVVGEPTDLDVCTAIKGVARYHVNVRGTSCHSGTPDEGRDAIRAAGELIDRIAALDDDLETTSHSILSHEDITVTEIDGGLAPNVVAPEVSATVDWRFLPRQLDPDRFDSRLQEQMEELSVEGTSFDVDIDRTVFARAGETDPEHPMVKQAIDAIRTAGAPGGVVGFNAATDARFFIHDAGIPTIHFGPGSLTKDAHTVDESILVDDLERAVHGYEAILDRLLLGGQLKRLKYWCAAVSGEKQ